MALYNSFGTLTHFSRMSRVSPLRAVLSENMRQGWNNDLTAKQREGASFLLKLSVEGDLNHFCTEARSIGTELSQFASFDWQMGKYFILFYIFFWRLWFGECWIGGYKSRFSDKNKPRLCRHGVSNGFRFKKFSTFILLLETAVHFNIH